MGGKLIVVVSIALVGTVAVIAMPSAPGGRPMASAAAEAGSSPSAQQRRGGTLFLRAPGFATTLFGRFEVGSSGRTNAGDSDGKGWATVALVGPWTVCYSIVVTKIGNPTGAHVHAGRAGENGRIVVPLTPPIHRRAAPRSVATSSGCVAAPEAIVRAIRARPTGFYVNVHTSDFPAGALRGQLSS